MTPNLMTPAQRAKYSRERQIILNNSGSLTVMGPAGTGKTNDLAERVKDDPEALIVTPTHRAANVLRSRIKDREIGTFHSKLVEWFSIPPELFNPKDIVGTVQRAIMNSTSSKGGRFETVGDRIFSWHPRITRDPKTGEIKSIMIGVWVDIGDSKRFVYVDEGSMVGDRQVRLMIKLANAGQMRFFLDPYQLPPVKANPFWIDIEPSVMLSKNYRQDGPLLQTLTNVRNSRSLYDAQAHLPYGYIPHDVNWRIWNSTAITIAWRNITVANYNRTARSELGLPTNAIIAGEPLICCENMPEIGVFNNQPINVEFVMPDGTIKLVGQDGFFKYTLRHAKPHEPVINERVYDNDVLQTLPTLPLCSAFCITAHSAQGREWDEVYVIDEGNNLLGMNWDIAKRVPEPGKSPFLIQTPDEIALSWLYTAATRAKKTLVFEPAWEWNRRTAAEYITPAPVF